MKMVRIFTSEDAKTAIKNNPSGNIIIPEGVTEIGPGAFESCHSLESIVIPEGVTEIGMSAFAHCRSLRTAAIPESVVKIDDYAFYDCETLKSIVIPEGVTDIGHHAFGACSSLTGIIIPDGVTKLNTSVFNRCYALKSIVLPEGVTEIGAGAFEDCESLKYINIPEGVTKIWDYAFKGCKSLKSIAIPGGDESNYKYGSRSGIQEIGKRIFDQCYGLETVTIHCGSGCWLTPDMFGRNRSNLRSVRITHYSFEDAYSIENKDEEYIIRIPKSKLVDGSCTPHVSEVCNLFTDMCINLGMYMNKREE